MEKLKKERSLLRRLYSTAEKELEKAFADECDDIHALYIFCKDKAEILFRVDDQIKECWFSEEANEDEIYADFVKTDSYKRRWTILFTKYERVFTNPTQKTYEVGSIASEGTTIKSKKLCGNTRNKDRRFKLPKIELRKFDGDVKNWISFWGQFRKIHEDVDIDSSDKFQYLIQATEPDSKARQLVESFPPSGENYSKAMEQLKERFARDDLLIETYIRGLLQLVLMRNYNNNITLRDLYDKLTTQLQALESLNVTSDKYASMLLPMVESAIPVEIQKNWERTRSSSDGSQLTNLLNFIKKEVESEERIVAAREGFDNIASTSDLLPTASCVVVGEIGITADIQKALLQISVNSKDRQYLQFLWWKDYREHRELLTYRHKRVVFGVTCSPFLLAATINYHLDSIKDERKPITEKLKGSFYVDNCVTSVKSQEECTEFITVAKCLMNEGKFNLRDWVTGPCKEGNVFPVLGLMWDNKDDFLYYRN